MNIQTNYPKLRTDRSPLIIWLRAGLTFSLLFDWVDSPSMCKDLDIIAYPYQGKHAKKRGIFCRHNLDMINAELQRRGIDYKVKNNISLLWTPIIAMNLLCADYNINH